MREGWRDLAACKDSDTSLFFREERPQWRALQAKALCGRCEVRQDCLEFALKSGEWDGVWGGLTVDERRELVRRRRAATRRQQRARREGVVMFRCRCGHRLRDHDAVREDAYVRMPCGECDCPDYERRRD
jgi:WhiB family redox-sensing transcriptional regulator